MRLRFTLPVLGMISTLTLSVGCGGDEKGGSSGDTSSGEGGGGGDTNGSSGGGCKLLEECCDAATGDSDGDGVEDKVECQKVADNYAGSDEACQDYYEKQAKGYYCSGSSGGGGGGSGSGGCKLLEECCNAATGDADGNGLDDKIECQAALETYGGDNEYCQGYYDDTASAFCAG